ncbi:MarR family winged helix-turn-helix transcriptional regulator [Streptomyces chromofuscus]|uniref:Winged helix-turn-helix transcriptional regulator n=1 Tax=Streptomyces chromofuscus TaxID=42881 RepID=A0A7M2TAA0_STRCW|nr:MarR family winged helix-turn-helix transcriptional regulator [Streptomyces chromofuscus]QOV45164.1 winged helix-turn-helix transcriptional regulator [Streptomyces chromofuscus]GGT33419.1 transcriptional regulator [Streptomyces chromofuscus]
MSDDATLITQWNRLTRFHRRIEARMERHLHRHLGLGVSEFYALRALREGVRAGTGLLYLNDLANGIGLSQSATSRLVTRLQDRGLITTHTSSLDRRSVEIELTAVAHDVLRLGSPLLHQAVEEVVRQLGAEDTEEDLIRYLRGSGDGGATPPPVDHVTAR